MVHFGFSYGHGLNTPGKEIPASMGVGKVKEFTLNKAVGEHCRNYLLNNYKNVKVTLLNDISGNVDTSLSERSNKANSLNVDAVIDFHHNAGGGTGIIVYKFIRGTAGTTDVLAQAVMEELLKSPGNKGDRWKNLLTENFHMLRETAMPAILIENGFMDNVVDAKKIVTEDYQLKSGISIAKALARVYKLEVKPQQTPPPTSQPSPTGVKRVIVDGKQVGAYKENSNVLNQVKKALDGGAKKIEITRV